METYQYRPLENRRTIRLLELHPTGESSGRSTVRCSIRHASLDDSELEYYALSYTWEGERTASMSIDDKSVRITVNLERALRRLRTNLLSCCNVMCTCRADGPLAGVVETTFTWPALLWVDAVCINQDDIQERNKQVQQMRDIYGGAKEVVVWLGEEFDGTVSAIRLLYGFADLYMYPVEDARKLLSHVIQSEHFQDAWIALGKFLHQSWWNRIWVIQEIVMARKATMICGEWAICWEDVRKASLCFRLCSIYIDEVMEATCLSGQPSYFEDFMSGQTNLNVMQMLKLFMGSNMISPGQDVFCSLLQTARNFSATDPRDKIYGLFGICERPGANHGLQVNYGLGVCELYMQTAKCIYELSNTLDFLGLVERQNSQNPHRSADNLNLPSWTPDWTVPTNMRSLLGEGVKPKKRSIQNPNPRGFPEHFSFSGNSTASCKFNLHEKTLTVTGFVVDTIENIESRLKDLDSRISLEGATRYGPRICWRPPSPEEAFVWDDFWQSRLDLRHPHKEQVTDNPDVVTECTASDDSANWSSVPRLDLLCFASKARRLLGLADSEIQHGDSICALFGAKVPYILRKQDDRWYLVGQW